MMTSAVASGFVSQAAVAGEVLATLPSRAVRGCYFSGGWRLVVLEDSASSWR